MRQGRQVVIVKGGFSSSTNFQMAFSASFLPTQ